MSNSTIFDCKSCGQQLRLPIDQGQLNVTCPSCGHCFDWSPEDENSRPDPSRRESGVATGSDVSATVWFHDSSLRGGRCSTLMGIRYLMTLKVFAASGRSVELCVVA